MANVLMISSKDNVVTALTDLSKGTKLSISNCPNLDITTRDPIPFGHKVAIAPIAKSQTVIKYGASIGIAIKDVFPGQHVHTHNLQSVRGTAKA